MLEDSFYGITVGTEIVVLSSNKIKKATTVNGEGYFDVYNILSYDNEKIGYFHSNPFNQSLIVGMYCGNYT
ncbi:hypothetical protein A8C32_17265 [Flavivirga aquatica]|uniref:Uncharacterized protein n=1 Tax=Flavivirga aquatica TaxID=1849968 RepID=A0A1E5T877_9FLAO|nr:hypothetical protein [Flavivirga aquatica]OEK07546.1 hypothetical protein A8C32_17265 [Flavivirga aquatica]